jgi:hypothetical protein
MLRVSELPRDYAASCGGRYRTRTDDLFRVKEARYQLRQSPVGTILPQVDRSKCTGCAATCRRDAPGAHRFGVGDKVRIESSPHAEIASECGCGAVVAHNLAKVGVASSNLVIRSSEVSRTWEPSMVAWPRGEAAACKAVHTGSNPVATSTHMYTRAIGAAVARFPDTEEVTGSIPVSPTNSPREIGGFRRLGGRAGGERCVDARPLNLAE